MKDFREGPGQCRAFVFGADGDPQILVDSRHFEMANDDVFRSECGRNFPCVAGWMPGEHEIGGRRNDGKTDVCQIGDEFFTGGHDSTARDLEVGVVLECGGGTGDGQSIKGIGVEAVLDPFQGLDKFDGCDGEAYP